MKPPTIDFVKIVIFLAATFAASSCAAEEAGRVHTSPKVVPTRTQEAITNSSGTRVRLFRAISPVFLATNLAQHGDKSQDVQAITQSSVAEITLAEKDKRSLECIYADCTTPTFGTTVVNSRSIANQTATPSPQDIIFNAYAHRPAKNLWNRQRNATDPDVVKNNTSIRMLASNQTLFVLPVSQAPAAAHKPGKSLWNRQVSSANIEVPENENDIVPSTARQTRRDKKPIDEPNRDQGLRAHGYGPSVWGSGLNSTDQNTLRNKTRTTATLSNHSVNNTKHTPGHVLGGPTHQWHHGADAHGSGTDLWGRELNATNANGRAKRANNSGRPPGKFFRELHKSGLTIIYVRDSDCGQDSPATPNCSGNGPVNNQDASAINNKSSENETPAEPSAFAENESVTLPQPSNSTTSSFGCNYAKQKSERDQEQGSVERRKCIAKPPRYHNNAAGIWRRNDAAALSKPAPTTLETQIRQHSTAAPQTSTITSTYSGTLAMPTRIPFAIPKMNLTYGVRNTTRLHRWTGSIWQRNELKAPRPASPVTLDTDPVQPTETASSGPSSTILDESTRTTTSTADAKFVAPESTALATSASEYTGPRLNLTATGILNTKSTHKPLAHGVHRSRPGLWKGVEV